MDPSSPGHFPGSWSRPVACGWWYGSCDSLWLQILISALVKLHSPILLGTGQLVALDLIYVSGEKSQPEPGELTDLTAQHFIRFEPENLQSTARRQLIIRNAT